LHCTSSLNPRKDLDAQLRVLQGAHGKRYWRSLEELAETPAFRELIEREFPEQASEWPSHLSRRQFLTLMGASLALAGLSGCSVRPAPRLDNVPYVKGPDPMVVPGRPLFFATAMTIPGGAIGLLVESHMGRPTKVEGNPDHPASLGATDAFAQASVLTLYDPDRSQTVTELGETRSWDSAATLLRAAMLRQRPRRGAGLRLLTETIVSPTLGWQLEQFFQEFSEARWHQYEPVNRDMAQRAARLAFGTDVNTIHDFSKADVVVALDADFLTCGPARLRYTADFMTHRRISTVANPDQARMNRLYSVETTVTCTGAKADHRLALDCCFSSCRSSGCRSASAA
jgi:molybdopterin-containing oxidoreductase family iron-sulfur binding subunit